MFGRVTITLGIGPHSSVRVRANRVRIRVRDSVMRRIRLGVATVVRVQAECSYCNRPKEWVRVFHLYTHPGVQTLRTGDKSDPKHFS